jgi:hypothetical protein
MSPSDEIGAAGRMWLDLSPETRSLLGPRIAGLYGISSAGSVFDSLGADKRQALGLLYAAFDRNHLWEFVRRIDNVYGHGGVGFSFSAWPSLKTELMQSRNFTQRLARHRGAVAGFFEKRVLRASLHLLCFDLRSIFWTAHFDLYNPAGSLRSAATHLVWEKALRRVPDWRQISSVLPSGIPLK